MTPKDILEYEAANSIAKYIGWDWGQGLMAKYLSWKVNRKWKRYKDGYEIRQLIKKYYEKKQSPIVTTPLNNRET